MNETSGPLSELAAKTQEIYERNADRFDAERPKSLHERGWIERFLEAQTPDGRVLDLGCGTGDPIAAYIAGRGFRVTGIDAAPAMLAIARLKAPAGDWRLADMRTLDLPERLGGIIGWDSFFHLTQDEQRAVLPRLVRHLTEPGVLLLTVGPDRGEVDGRVGDDRVYHASLSPDEYRSILESVRLRIVVFVAEDPTCDFHTVLLARSAS